MYFNRAIILAIASLLPALTTQSPGLQRRDGVACGGQNDEPPLITDVQSAIGQLNDLGSGTQCGNDNGGGSRCTTMVTSGSAAISMCGNKISMPCNVAAQFATDVLNQCMNGQIAEGQYNGGGWYIPVFNSDKV